MDKSWMMENRMSREYDVGVESFIQFGLSHAKGSNSIRCPCLKCGNRLLKDVSIVRYHLYANGIDKSYKIWFWHGEDLNSETVTSKMENLGDEKYEHDDLFNTVNMLQSAHDESCNTSNTFDTMFDDAKKPLYPGCKKFTKLSALVRLYNLKVRYGWSNTSFSELLSIISDLLPDNNEIPTSLYEAKKTLGALGLSYQKIDACPNDCCLYRKEYANSTKCPKCGLSRWKINKNSTKENSGVAAKQMWYFPIVPRFIRMFKNFENAKNLRWHAMDRKIDDIMRHPADTPSWRLIDHMWPTFGSEPRNLRLGLSTDGINPFGDLSSNYSCWPVITTIYNLPPWLCMRRKHLMLTMLISGPKQPGYDINTYLAPLIDDLKILWEEGVQCFDAYKEEYFTLRAVLLWTINDFSAYDYFNQTTTWKKNVYMGHRKYLPRYHPYRLQKKNFDGKQEHGKPPQPLSGEAIYFKLKEMIFSSGKNCGKNNNEGGNDYWKRRSEFFELPYWKNLHVRHCLDVMHIEKNVCMNIVGTLLDLPGKSKDGMNNRLDLVDMNIRPELAPMVTGNKTYIPAACYTLSREEKYRFCKTLAEIKVPEGYSSNIRSIVSLNDLKLNGLKSHDCHVLMQQLLPIAIRSILPKNVRYTISRLCFFFNAICAKSFSVSELDALQEDIVMTLCNLEKYFPPSFFTIMVHLVVHLVREVKLCGPVYLRWMYPFERYMKVLKSFVRNRNRPEGCIAEAQVCEEAVHFCSDFLSGLDEIGLGSLNSREEKQIDRPLSAGTYVRPDMQELKQAHLHILQNTEEVMCELHEGKVVSNTIRWLAHGPNCGVMTYDGYMVNGCSYHTKSRDDHRTVQNSGIMLVATTMQVSSAKDKNPVIGDMSFYGIIEDIWEVSYNTFNTVLFKCKWVENKNGVRIDDLHFTLVDLSRIGHSSDSFIIATHGQQVFYVSDPVDPRWSVVVRPPQKDFPYKCANDDLGDMLPHYPPVSKWNSTTNIDESGDAYTRLDCEGIWFLDSGSISCGSSKEERAQLLTARLLGTDYDQLLLFPYNFGNHWTLVVINLTKDAAFWIDPLKNRIDPDVTEVVERSFNIMNKKKPAWRIVKCPKQSGVVECGYYVMRFMRDIIMSTSTSIIQICVVDLEMLLLILKCVDKGLNKAKGNPMAFYKVDKDLNKAKGNPMAFYKVLPQSIGAMKPWIRQLVDV
ncbi:hypothetical protein IC582_016447 [Cucumis melo]